jgi:hypothetical protein
MRVKEPLRGEAGVLISEINLVARFQFGELMILTLKDRPENPVLVHELPDNVRKFFFGDIDFPHWYVPLGKINGRLTTGH